ncbi:hypothetical protein IW150_005479 [Coemansia sp. RSA 2607]|nr:hypothetical protein IW150_005479 [Coemansia sp. RSA 2607]
MHVRRSLSHKHPLRQPIEQRLLKANTFSPSSPRSSAWNYETMADAIASGSSSGSENGTETTAYGRSMNNENSNNDDHYSSSRNQTRPTTLHHIVRHQERRSSHAESATSSKLKSHSHDGTLAHESSVICGGSSIYRLESRPVTQNTSYFQRNQYQHQHHQPQQQICHLPNDSPDLLNSRQLRRQFARYSCSISPKMDEEQMIAFNSGSGHMRDGDRGSIESTQCDDNDQLRPTVLDSLKNAAQASWLNVLIVFVPLGYIAHYLRWPVVAVFVLNYLAIIPLSALMGFATEEVSIRFGPTWGGVVNAVFGNAVELIVAVIALIEEEYRIVQAGLIGSVLSNTLLVLGCAFLAGGLRHRVQFFHAEAAQCAGALLALSVLSMIIPAAYHGVHASGGEITNGILIMSRGTALILLVVYILFLIFQLKTHSDIFDGSHTPSNAPSQHACCSAQDFHPCNPDECDRLKTHEITHSQDPDCGEQEIPELRQNLGLNVCLTTTKCEHSRNIINDDKSVETTSTSKTIKRKRDCHLRHSAPQMKMWVAVVLLLVISGLVALSSDVLVDSVQELTSHYSISHTFVGMILLPIAASAAEHTMSITVAVRNKMDLCITVAVGSSMQMTLLVLPLLIIIAWILNRPLTLFFDDFETTTMLISVLVINYLIMNGRSNWLKGAMLLSSYFIVALAFFLYPNENENKAVPRAEGSDGNLTSTSSAEALIAAAMSTASAAKLSFL